MEEKESIFPENGDILRHKKGNYYRVLEAHTKHSETSELMVVYQSIVTKEIWVRPRSMFTSDRFKIAIEAEDISKIL